MLERHWNPRSVCEIVIYPSLPSNSENWKRRIKKIHEPMGKCFGGNENFAFTELSRLAKKKSEWK